MTSSDQLKHVVSKYLRKHRRARNRYIAEVVEYEKGRLTKTKLTQIKYSYQRANEELAICDVLEKLLNEVKR